MKKKTLLLSFIVTVLAAIAAAGYHASIVYNFRPMNKVLDPDIITIHDAWATRTAPGQPTLPPDAYAESVTLSVWSDNPTYLRALETWLNHHGHTVRKSAYRDDLRHDTDLQYLEFHVHENELFPISEQLAKWPTVYRVDLTTDYGPGAPLNSPASCAHRFVNALRLNPQIKNPDDIPPSFVGNIDANYSEPCYPGMGWHPTLQPTIDDCVIDNPVLNIHRREFYHRLLESYNGADPIVRDDAGNMLVPTSGTYVSNCVMYNATERKWYQVRQKWTNPH